MKKWILAALLSAFAAMAWALPTLQEVETEVHAGRYAQAEAMMREVVDAKPGSAKAHYVYAEILAHQGKVALEWRGDFFPSPGRLCCAARV